MTSPHASPAATVLPHTKAPATATSSSAGEWWERSRPTSSAGRRQRRSWSSLLESSPRRRRRSARLEKSGGSGEPNEREGRQDDRAPDRHRAGVAGGTARAARRREGAHAAGRR